MKNISTNYLVISLALGIVIAFIFGYFTGIESEHDKNRTNQDIKKLEEKIDELDKQEAVIYKVSKNDDPMLGDPDAPISIIEFSDYQCPFCARFYSQTLPLLEEEYINKGIVNFVYRDYPIKSHLNAMPAAIASECADDQGKFWEMHDMLFQRQSMWKVLEFDMAITTFKEYASELNLEQRSFDTCLDSGKYLEEVEQDLKDGRNNKITGTPTFFIGNEELGYTSMYGAKSFSDFAELIDEKINK